MGCNYYIIDSAYGDKSRYNIKDDSGTSLFYYGISDNDSNKFELFDLENNELILTTCKVNDFESKKYNVSDDKERNIFHIFKNYYFASMSIRGIFGDFTVSKTVTHKRSFDLLKNGLVIANIDERNKFNDNHLSIRIYKDEFALVALVVYLLIDINRLFDRY